MAGRGVGGILCSRAITAAGAILTTLFLISILVYVESHLLRKWSTRPLFTHGESAKSTSASDTVVDRDENCVARSEQHLYRDKSLRFPPSEALTKRWTRYLRLHQFCSSHITNWTEAFLSNAEVAERASCRYLIFMEGSAGLGNKILALVSAFSYALATDRVLLIETGCKTKLGRLLCEPFHPSSWLLPLDFPYDLVRRSPSLGEAYEAGLTSVPVVNLHLEHIQSSGDQKFFCDGTHHDLTRDVTWLAWTSTQYYSSRLLMLPSFWHGLLPLFPGLDIFTQLGRLIVVPQNSIWQQLVRFYRGYLSCSGVRVGVQIRLHGRWDMTAFDTNVQARVLECLQGSGLVPRISDPNVTHSDVNTTRSGEVVGGSNVSLLVASLQHKYYEEMKRIYSDRATDDGRIVSVHTCGDGGQQDETLRQARTALLEMWLLSLSDAIATSAYSTFGYVAQGLAGLRPLIMNVRGEAVGAGDDLPPCYRGHSSEPCTHFPMLNPVCPNTTVHNPVTEEHQRWIEKHFLACQDQEGGVQLM